MDKVIEVIKANELVTDHFSFDEFKCPCCDTLKITPGFFRHVEKLEKMRQMLGIPITVNSGHRCIKHNAEVGGKPESWHLLFASDIRTGNPEDLKEMYKMAVELEFKGIGRYGTFIHLDLRPEDARWEG